MVKRKGVKRSAKKIKKAKARRKKKKTKSPMDIWLGR